jgi:hypothetical protein
MPVFPDSRSDENHAQIASDIIGEDNGKTLENTDIMSPTISKNRLAEPPLPLPKNTQKDPEGTLATLPLLTCLFCNVFATPIVFDMENHLLEKHKPQLVKDLPLKGRGYKMDYRIEYAISMMMRRLK